MRAWVLSAVIATIGLGVTPVRADVVRENVKLNWLAPEHCPQRAEFLDAVARMLGNRIAIDHPLFVDVVITQSTGASFQLKLATTLAGTSGQRVLQGRSCRVVADAAAVTLALLLNPDLEVPTEPKTGDIRPPTTKAPTATSSTVVAPPIPERQVRPRNTHATAFRGLLSSQFGLLLGALPRANPQFSLGVGVGHKRASIWASGSYSPPQNDTLTSLNVGGRLWTIAAGVQGCWLWLSQSPRVGNCIGAELTRILQSTGELGFASQHQAWCLSPGRTLTWTTTAPSKGPQKSSEGWKRDSS